MVSKRGHVSIHLRGYSRSCVDAAEIDAWTMDNMIALLMADPGIDSRPLCPAIGFL